MPPFVVARISLAAGPSHTRTVRFRYRNAAPRARLSVPSECFEEGHQIGALLVGEAEAELELVVPDDVLERRGHAVVKVRGARGERTHRRHLEPPEVVPRTRAVSTARVGHLPDLARGDS